MKKIVFFLIIVLLSFSCRNKEEKLAFDRMLNRKIAEKDSIGVIADSYLKKLEQSNWIIKFKDKILNDNPKFKIDSTKSIGYFVVPIMDIANSVLIRDSINMESYFNKGELTADGAECYVLEEGLPVGRFILNENSPFPARPDIFSDYIRKRNIDEAQKSDLYFKIAIKVRFAKTKTYRIYLPGIVFLNKENSFMFLNYDDNTIYPISEIYKTYTKNKDEFRKFINGFIERREN